VTKGLYSVHWLCYLI